MSKQLGDAAENAVAEFLKKQGYEILERNWRTRWCEIDIIAKHHKTVFFVEVKFRSSADQGDGFAYITTRKLKQMNFAAQFWLAQNNWAGSARLAAASVDKDMNIDYLDDIV